MNWSHARNQGRLATMLEDLRGQVHEIKKPGIMQRCGSAYLCVREREPVCMEQFLPFWTRCHPETKSPCKRPAAVVEPQQQQPCNCWVVQHHQPPMMWLIIKINMLI
eukprot:scaffold13697_cov25-Prasinocladus_malaysianus.AAC.1